jgi:mRNA interferase MazF
VILAYVPNVGSAGGKVRPALIVQSDHNNARLNETIIAAITSNTSRVHEPTQLLIEVATPEGAASGVLHDSAVRCERLHAIPQGDVRRVIGRLSDAVMRKIDDCLKAALGVP